jgi:hypothetical protein
MNPSKQDEAEDHAAALINVAAWFARWVVASEIGYGRPGLEDPMEISKLPEPFRQLVAAQMVIAVDEFMGWPDVDEALVTLGELYGWGPE